MSSNMNEKPVHLVHFHMRTYQLVGAQDQTLKLLSNPGDGWDPAFDRQKANCYYWEAWNLNLWVLRVTLSKGIWILESRPRLTKMRKASRIRLQQKECVLSWVLWMWNGAVISCSSSALYLRNVKRASTSLWQWNQELMNFSFESLKL